MAKLIGYLKGNRGEVSRLATKEIEATLQTWKGRVRLTLWTDGTFNLDYGDIDGSNREKFRGKVPS